jgi:hypothetical protein
MYEERDLAELFMKEKEYYNYTLEEFKVWLKEAAPEEDWRDINRWGVLDHFTTLTLRDFRIFDYLFQLGMNTSFIYSESFHQIKRLEEKTKDPKYNHKKYILEIIKDSKELLSICEKYMTEEDKRISLYSHELAKYA